jgi:hypothetical protein
LKYSFHFTQLIFATIRPFVSKINQPMPVDTKTIIEKYKGLRDHELVDLSKNPAELREDVIPILQQELISRGYTTEAQSITDWQNAVAADPQFGLTDEQVQVNSSDWVKEARKRVIQDETLETILNEAHQHGNDTLEMLKSQDWFQEQLFDHVKELRKQGNEDYDIDQHLQEHHTSFAEAISYRGKLRRRAGWLLVPAFTSLAIGLLRVEANHGGMGIYPTVILLCGSALLLLSLVSFMKSL